MIQMVCQYTVRYRSLQSVDDVSGGYGYQFSKSYLPRYFDSDLTVTVPTFIVEEDAEW